MSISELLDQEAVADRICEETLRKQGIDIPGEREYDPVYAGSASQGHIQCDSIRMSETISGNRGCRF